MSILPHQKLKKQIDSFIENADEDAIGPASYEFSIGAVRVPGSSQKIALEEKQHFGIQAGGLLLVGTKEKVKLPSTVAACLFLKSSLGRIGLAPWSQGFVDPGYSGTLTISMFNATDRPQFLQMGQRFCHLVLFELTEATERPYEGPYKNSEGPTPSKAPYIPLLGRVGLAVVQGAAEGIASTIASS